MHPAHAELDAAIRNAISHAMPTPMPLENSHWTVCIKDARGESLGVIELASQQEVGVLAVELARHGYFPLVDDPDAFDFVFAPECVEAYARS